MNDKIIDAHEKKRQLGALHLEWGQFHMRAGDPARAARVYAVWYGRARAGEA